MFKRIAIIGLGLIGGSLGLAIKDAHPGAEVWGVDQTQEVITKAREMGAIDGGTLDLGQSVKGAELVIIATPLGVIEEILIKVAPHLQKGAIVTDVGSTKQKVVQWMETLLPPGVEGVGGHPMAGSEKSSVLGATANLLVQAPYILTPTPKNKEETMEKLRGFFSSLGAKVYLLSPEEHDHKVGAISHLPHLIAAALVSTVGTLEEKESGYFQLAGGGFRDTTRIAASNSSLWREILLDNTKVLLPLVSSFKESLVILEQALAAQDPHSLEAFLQKSQNWRQEYAAKRGA